MNRKQSPCRMTAAFAAVTLLFTGCTSQSTPQETEAISYNIINESDKLFIIDNAKYSKPLETEFIDIPSEMKLTYGYDQLDKNEKEIYDLLSNAVKNCSPSVEIPNIDRSGELYNRVLELIRCENGAFFNVIDRRIGETTLAAQSFDIEFTYRFTAEQVNFMLRESEKAADVILSEITADMSGYDIIKYFHDTLITNCSSDTSSENANNIYGALVEKKALCEGYAKAFSYLCSRAGIENIIVTGRTDEAHMWNMVKLDGNWYHIDVTWDNPDSALAAAYPDTVLYSYFLVSDAEILAERTMDTTLFTPPRATGSVLNYFYHEGMYADSYNAALNAVETGCRNAIGSGRHSFMLKAASSDLYNTIIYGLSARNGEGSTDMAAAMENAGFSGRISYTDMYSDKRILIFLLDY